MVSVNFESLLGYRTRDYEGQAPKKANGCGFGRDFPAYLCIGLYGTSEQSLHTGSTDPVIDIVDAHTGPMG